MQVIVLALVLGLACGQQQVQKDIPRILNDQREVNGGNFRVAFRTENGIVNQEEQEGKFRRGAYEFINAEGNTERVEYIAGPGIGFRITGGTNKDLIVPFTPVEPIEEAQQNLENTKEQSSFSGQQQHNSFRAQQQSTFQAPPAPQSNFQAAPQNSFQNSFSTVSNGQNFSPQGNFQSQSFRTVRPAAPIRAEDAAALREQQRLLDSMIAQQSRIHGQGAATRTSSAFSTAAHLPLPTHNLEGVRSEDRLAFQQQRRQLENLVNGRPQPAAFQQFQQQTSFQAPQATFQQTSFQAPQANFQQTSFQARPQQGFQQSVFRQHSGNTLTGPNNVVAPAAPVRAEDSAAQREQQRQLDQIIASNSPQNHFNRAQANLRAQEQLSQGQQQDFQFRSLNNNQQQQTSFNNFNQQQQTSFNNFNQQPLRPASSFSSAPQQPRLSPIAPETHRGETGFNPPSHLEFVQTEDGFRSVLRAL